MPIIDSYVYCIHVIVCMYVSLYINKGMKINSCACMYVCIYV
jgi:hypothetical protein